MMLNIQNAKTQKGEALGWLTGVLYLAPHSLGGKNVCASSTPGCRASCLYTAGRAKRYAHINGARMLKTSVWHLEPEEMHAQIDSSIAALVRKALREGLRPCVRLNGTSDLPALVTAAP